MIRTSFIWALFIAAGLFVTVAQRLVFETPALIGIGLLAALMLVAMPLANRVADRLRPRARRDNDRLLLC